MQENDGLQENDDLQREMDKVMAEKNEIDCVFFATVGDGGDGDVIRMTPPSSDPLRQFPRENVSKILMAVEKLEDIKYLDKGELDYMMVQFGNSHNGGIICFSIVPNSNPKLWLGFISATHQGLAQFLSFRKKYLAEIIRLSKIHLSAYFSK